MACHRVQITYLEIPSWYWGKKDVPRPRLDGGGIGVCTVLEVMASTVAISFVFVNYCPNID